jgi:hypothetical protein
MDDFLSTITRLGSGIISQLSNLTDIDPNKAPEKQYRPNPYGFPESSLNESDRTRELLNSEGDGILLPVADQMVDAAPMIYEGLSDAGPQIVEGLSEAGPQVAQGLSDAMPQMASGLSSLPEEVANGGESAQSFPGNNLFDDNEVGSAVDQAIAADAQRYSRLATGVAEKTIKSGSESDNIDLFDMVKSAAKVVGSGIEMGYDQWKKLAPSTRLAMIGSAASAYAYKRGWDKTAGDVAATTAGMYGNMYSQEVDADTSMANAKTKAEQETLELMSKSNEADATKDDREYNLGQLTTLLQDQFSGIFSDDEAGLANATNALFNEWNQVTKGNKKRQAAYPLTAFLKDKKSQKDLEAERAARTNFQPATPLGSR